MQTALINSIYLTTEGEGLHLGTPQVFIRFQGCAVGCLNCDSKDTWDFTESMAIELPEIIGTVRKLSRQGKIRRVSITGGDPLHPKHVPAVLSLCQQLKNLGHEIVLEAAGTRVVHEIFDLLDFINFDFKTPSTGVKTRLNLIEEMILHYSGRFQVKAVIETREDFLAAKQAYETLATTHQDKMPPWILTPAYNLAEPFPRERFLEIINWNQDEAGFFRVVGQQHKWLHGPDEKQV